jgi:hypothetical protein
MLCRAGSRNACCCGAAWRGCSTEADKRMACALVVGLLGRSRSAKALCSVLNLGERPEARHLEDPRAPESWAFALVFLTMVRSDVGSLGLTFELTPPTEAGGVSLVCDSAEGTAQQAYAACRSGSGVERGVRHRRRPLA